MTNNFPKLTIVTVCFNIVKSHRVESFKRCVESVRRQTYGNIEHLVIDGASKDGTLDILKEYADKGMLKYISEPDKGIYDAMSKGVEHASGEYCYFLNTDDYLHDDTVVADVMNFFEKNKVDACFGNIIPYVLDENANYLEVFEPNEVVSFADIYDKEDILRRNIHHQTIFYNKKIFGNSSFFDEENKDGSDWVLHCQAFLKNDYVFKHINRVITCFNLGGVSTNADNNPVEEYLLLQKYLQNEYGRYAVETKNIKIGPLVLAKIKWIKDRKKVYLFGLIPVFSKKDYKKIISRYRHRAQYTQEVLFQKEERIKYLKEKIKTMEAGLLAK